MQTLSAECLPIWIKGDADHTQELIRRFDKAPKPMAYQPEFLLRVWKEYLVEHNCAPNNVNPDDFIRWAYAQALAHRQPRYEAMAKWSVTVTSDQVAALNTEADFVDLIGDALPA